MGVIKLFEQARTAKEDLRKQYAKCKDVSLERCALIDKYLDDEACKDYEDKFVITSEIMGYVIPNLRRRIKRKMIHGFYIILDDIYNTLYKEPKVAKEPDVAKEPEVAKETEVSKETKVAKEVIIISSSDDEVSSDDDVSSDEELTSDEVLCDDEVSSEEEASVIASSKRSSESLLKWYDDSSDEENPEYYFDVPKALKSKVSTSSVSNASISKTSKVSTSSASKSKAFTSNVSSSNPLTSSGYKKIAKTGCVLFLRAHVAPIEQFPFPRATDAGRKRRPNF
nr:hypothetical protein [Tanacetum cinerariifolium]